MMTEKTDAPVQYDNCNRMLYHPEYHDKHKSSYTVQDMLYIVSTYRWGKKREVALALGRTDASIASKVCLMKKNGDWQRFTDLYTKMYPNKPITQEGTQ